MTRTEMQQQALTSAVSSQALSNYPAIFAGFIEKGIAESDIRPRENVFTFHAWKALGRSVRKGEHGVRVVTFVPVSSGNSEATPNMNEGKAPRVYRLPRSTTVFHVSQTDPTIERAD